MYVVLMRGREHQLRRIVRAARLPMPFLDREGQRIGTVMRLWVKGGAIHADIECVPGDAGRIEMRKE